MSEKLMELQQQVRQNSDELQDFLRDLGNWTKQMEIKDEQLKQKKSESKSKTAAAQAPRSVDELKRKSSTPNENGVKVIEKKTRTVAIADPPKKSEKIASWDYDAWSKFDADKAMQDVDEKKESLEDTELRDMEPDVRLQRANLEKERGNAFFKNDKYSEAVGCYTRGMQCDPKNAILPANRAMAYLKLGEWRRAERDCSLSLSLDESYVKAYQRRGTARKNMKEYTKAQEDFQHVLLLEPNNKQAQLDLVELANIMTKEESNPKATSSATAANKLKGMFNSSSLASPTSEKSNVLPGQIFPVEKPPHLRSSVPLKRMNIIEVPIEDSEVAIKMPTLMSETTPSIKPLIEIMQETKEPENAPEESEDQSVIKAMSKSTKKTQKVEREINDSAQLVTASSSPPKKFKKPANSVQFTNTWSKLSSFQDKMFLLSLLKSSDYPKVFRHSMEPSIFSEILETLVGAASVSKHLLGLSRVPRVSALIMFLEEADLAKIKQIKLKVEEENLLSASESKEIERCFTS